jgi:hypothetical protein
LLTTDFLVQHLWSEPPSQFFSFHANSLITPESRMTEKASPLSDSS